MFENNKAQLDFISAAGIGFMVSGMIMSFNRSDRLVATLWVGGLALILYSKFSKKD